MDAARYLIEKEYSEGTYSLSFTIYDGDLDATIVFDTITQDTLEARSKAILLASDVKDLGARGVTVVATPDVESTTV